MQLQFGEILKNLRKIHHYKQQQLAEYLMISRPTYQRYEQNIVEMPLSKLFDLASFYNMKTIELINLITIQPQKDS